MTGSVERRRPPRPAAPRQPKRNEPRPQGVPRASASRHAASRDRRRMATGDRDRRSRYAGAMRPGEDCGPNGPRCPAAPPSPAHASARPHRRPATPVDRHASSAFRRRTAHTPRPEREALQPIGRPTAPCRRGTRSSPARGVSPPRTCPPPASAYDGSPQRLRPRVSAQVDGCHLPGSADSTTW